MASLAESVALIVSSEADKGYDEAWKEQALLLQQQRRSQRLEILVSMLDRATEDGKRLSKISRERDEQRDGDFNDVDFEAELEATIKKRNTLTKEIQELENALLYGGHE
ncbi:hypothetical protein DVH05_022607 [Phytophthora capsici]|nr:hypothetical protein DVH05_022607 [Phytophthora capsici]